MNPSLFEDGKAEEVIFLPSSKVGAYCIRPIIQLAKNGKAQEAIFPIRIG